MARSEGGMAEPAQQQSVPFRVREYMGESGFVAGSWLRNYLSSPWARPIEQDDYYRDHAQLVSQLIDRSTIWLAEWAGGEGDGVLLGFAVGERDERGPVVHYAYVKGDYRKQGIGGALVSRLLESLKHRVNEPVRYTHRRSPGCDIATTKGWKYTPYPALRGLERR
jgi:GNAT superfamily N-acetyltransferase